MGVGPSLGWEHVAILQFLFSEEIVILGRRLCEQLVSLFVDLSAFFTDFELKIGL